MKAKALMIQGTMRSVGKSTIVTGLCRAFAQDGIRVAPFKAQNRTEHGCIMTGDGVQIAWAQALQATAAGIEPRSDMNPVIINAIAEDSIHISARGEDWATLDERGYESRKKELVPVIQECYESLANDVDLVIIEGSGSPAEINVRENDIVNMGMAEIADCPVILVADISRGGAFAQLLGTVEFMTPEERKRVKGFVINKFQGDRSILETGLKMLEEKTQIPVLGVIPSVKVHLKGSDTLVTKKNDENYGDVDLAVVRFPRMTNATDLLPLDLEEGIRVRYVTTPEEIQKADLILLPSTKHTMSDLTWLRETGMEAQILKLHAAGCPVMGICGGFQMLSREILDPHHVEGQSSMRGMGLLTMTTEFMPEKTMRQSTGKVANLSGIWEPLSGKRISGYEIHMGESNNRGGNVFSIMDGRWSGASNDTVLGTYLHGIFEEEDFRRAFVDLLIQRRRVEKAKKAVQLEQEHQFDMLADTLRWNLDMDMVRRIIGVG